MNDSERQVPTESKEHIAPAELRFNPALLSLIQIALRRRKQVLALAAALVLAFSVTAAILPNLYTASVVIMPPQSGSTGAAMLAQLGSLGSLASSAALSIKNPNDLQVSLLKSHTVEDAMVDRFNLESEYRKRYLSSARKRWEKLTSVDNGLKDGLIRLTVTDPDPRRATELANGWVEEYRRLTASLAVTEASQRRLFFENELNGARDELTRAEDNLKDTQQRTGVIEIDGQTRALIASAAMLRAQVAAKEVEIHAMREFAANENPDPVQARQELGALEQQLTAMDVGSNNASGDLISPKGKVTQAGLDYERALRDVKYREAMYELLTRQYEIARVDEARQGAILQIVDPAMVPDRPSSQYRMWIVVAGLLLSLPLAVLMIAAFELFSNLSSSHRRSGSWLVACEEVIATW
jgi:uncharacterized protein involved in exopolysaccharide biosynthesis